MAATTSDATRRDFILVASGAMGAVAAGAVAWPLIQQMNPSAAALALATTEVDIATIQPGQQVIIKHRGQPLFVRRRTPAEIKSAQSVNVASLPERPGAQRRQGRQPARQRRESRHQGPNGWWSAASAPIWAAPPPFPPPPRRKAAMAAGSAIATVRTMILRGGSAAAPRRRTCTFRSIPS